ncbi:alpha/beta hydrolase-fold protein [Aerococcaceae bacterium NML210727]|nr:alpha/beta hydrolase-fold protein [Aerococcaceae bacterium NML210727]MCW6654216.1 alpha/beta hydrolase-fold protein [Aerococcaceae bacterium NML201296]
MKFEKRSHYSGSLGREMYFNVYGHAGKPIIVFPSSGGSQNEYADFGMIEACRSFIDRGLVRFYTPDSVDAESWFAKHKSPYDMANFHNQYDSYIIHELVPLIRHETGWQGALCATGCSMGGFHTINFALRHPDVFDLSIALSGVYDARFFTGEFYGDPTVYFNSPIDYLWNQNDDWFLERYRQNDFIICVGQGAWEEPHVADTHRLELAFNTKGIPAWFDFWGHDVAHDWDWWRQQMPYYLYHLETQGKL